VLLVFLMRFSARVAQYGPAGAFAQEYTVMRNTLSDNKLYDHEKASQYGTPDLTVPYNDRKTRSRMRMERQKP
jgi:hypothetical protein